MIRQSMKSKTMRYALIIDLLAIIQINAEELRAAIPAEYYGYFLIAVAFGIKYYRYKTDSSLQEK